MIKKHLTLTLLTALLFVSFTTTTVLAQNPFGTVTEPFGINVYQGNCNGTACGLTLLITNLLRTAIVIAGLYAVVNFLLAGYSFMSAGGDPKKIEDSWAKIYQTIIGLLFAVGAFIVAAMVSRLLFGHFGTIFQLKVFGP